MKKGDFQISHILRRDLEPAGWGPLVGKSWTGNTLTENTINEPTPPQKKKKEKKRKKEAANNNNSNVRQKKKKNLKQRFQEAIAWKRENENIPATVHTPHGDCLRRRTLTLCSATAPTEEGEAVTNPVNIWRMILGHTWVGSYWAF